MVFGILMDMVRKEKNMENKKLTMRGLKPHKRQKRKPREKKIIVSATLKPSTIEWAKKMKKEEEAYGYFLWRNEQC